MPEQKINYIATQNQSKWVAHDPRRNNHYKIRLLCFPFAGGGVAPYFAWINHIRPEIEFLRIQLPGREARLGEAPFTELKPLVKELAIRLKPWMIPPFAFYGHSMGALIAFELIRTLRKAKEPLPIHLFVSSYRAPHLEDPDPVSPNIPETQFVERLQQYEGIPEALVTNSELMEIFMPILRADFNVLNSYEYTEAAPISCPITAFGGSSDPKISWNEILAWQLHTNNRFHSHLFKGGHFFINGVQSEMITFINMYLRQSHKSIS